MTIVITPNIVPTFNPIGPICQNGSGTLPSASTNSPSIIGTWNPNIISTNTVGSSTYTFTPNAGQCASNATLNIEIIANPTINITPSTICSGQTITLTPTVTPSGGTYLWSNNQTSTSITVSPTITTSYSLLYTLSGCTTSGSVTITVNPNVTPAFASFGPYCQNETPDVLSTTSINGITGTWNPTSISTNTSGNQIYTFTPTTGLCASNINQTILVSPLITPTFNSISPLCQNSVSPILPLNSTNTPSISGTWNPSIISTTTVGNTNYLFTQSFYQSD
jgi:hypothetical protein